MSSESRLITAAVRSYALTELAKACAALMPGRPSKSPVRGRPAWLRQRFPEIRNSRQHRMVLNVMNKELGLILSEQSEQVKGMRPMRVSQLEALPASVLVHVYERANIKATWANSEVLSAVESAFDAEPLEEGPAIRAAIDHVSTAPEVDMRALPRLIVSKASASSIVQDAPSAAR